jgi:hypothetical protein
VLTLFSTHSQRSIQGRHIDALPQEGENSRDNAAGTSSVSVCFKCVLCDIRLVWDIWNSLFREWRARAQSETHKRNLAPPLLAVTNHIFRTMVRSTYWNIVSDFCGARFAVDVFALLEHLHDSDDEPRQPLALAFRVETFLKRLELRYTTFALVFYRRRACADSVAVAAHLCANAIAIRASSSKRVFEFK